MVFPDGKLLYVTDDSGDGISVIDATTFKVIHTIITKPILLGCERAFHSEILEKQTLLK
jgi:YVTN family beta-propeller protein